LVIKTVTAKDIDLCDILGGGGGLLPYTQQYKYKLELFVMLIVISTSLYTTVQI